MTGSFAAADVNFLPLQLAVFCVECELLSGNNTPRCLACGSKAILSLSRVLGGSLRGQPTAHLIVLLCPDTEFNPRVDLATCRHLGVRAILDAPLRHFRRTLGVFEVLSSAPNGLRPSRCRNHAVFVGDDGRGDLAAVEFATGTGILIRANLGVWA